MSLPSKNKKEKIVIEVPDDKNSHYDSVVHPKHYVSLPNGVECWDVTQFMTANIAQAMKYQWRAGLKPGQDTVQDLKKAIQFIQHEIDLLENNYPKMTR